MPVLSAGSSALAPQRSVQTELPFLCSALSSITLTSPTSVQHIVQARFLLLQLSPWNSSCSPGCICKRGSCGRNGTIVINPSEQKGSEIQYTTGQEQFHHSGVWQNFVIFLTKTFICHRLGLIQRVPSSAQVTCWLHYSIPALSQQREPWEKLPPLVHPEGCGAALRQ